MYTNLQKYTVAPKICTAPNKSTVSPKIYASNYNQQNQATRQLRASDTKAPRWVPFATNLDGIKILTYKKTKYWKSQ